VTPGRMLALAFFATALACSAKHPPSSPPPDLEGKIERIAEGSIRIEATPPVDVAVHGTTRITNAKGKAVGAGDLAVGMRVRVWLDTRSAGPLRLAAAMTIEGP